MPEFKKYRQRISSDVIGDCFRACMATLLQLPPEVLPNDFSPRRHINWQNYLAQFGLILSYEGNAKQAIWAHQPWLASVKSLNYKTTHAILMHDTNIVFWDPSTKKRYKTGTRLDSETVLGGSRLEVLDTSKLHLLQDYRNFIEGKK